jgi:ribosomal protein S18 acetylase RimI-like enzyme
VTVELRPARAADVDDVRAVAASAWRDAHEPIVGRESVEAFLDEHYDADSIRGRIEDDATLVSVAADPARGVVGFATAVPGDGAVYDLGQLYVHPDRWREGLGSRLLVRIERRVASRGGERITLRVMAENERAVGFYEAAGYELETETYDDAIETTARVYAKSL